ncbi:MAG: GreA/GreB family elongation factor [Acidobacteriota bacterium]
MAISKQTQAHLSKGNFEAIEDEWLGHSSKQPEDLDYFVGVARALIGNNEADRSRFLLEILDDLLIEKELWEPRLKLLRRIGPTIYEPEDLHKAILVCLRSIYDDHSMYELLESKVGLDKVQKDPAKTWDRVDRLKALMGFDIGTPVWMVGRGAGRIVEINIALESFKVDLERHKGLMVGFRAAAKMLQALEPDHVLRQKLEDPESLRELAKQDPSELLRRVLVSYNSPMTATEVRQALTGVITEKGWNRWWTAARKHPQVLTQAKGRQNYRWAATSEDAFSALWTAFERAGIRGKIDLLKRNADRDAGLKKRMVDALHKAGEEVKSSRVGRAFEIWHALDRAGTTLTDVEWTPETLVAQSPNLLELVGGLDDRALRQRVYELVQNDREDWPQHFGRFIAREEDPRLLDLLLAGLTAEAPEERKSFIEQLLSQPRKNPAGFVWLAERASDDDGLRQHNPLRLLKQLLTALQDEAFASYRASRLVPLLESGGTAPKLLQDLEPEQAEPARDAITKSAALEGYQRDALVTSLELKFSDLRDDQDAPLYALESSIETKREEFRHLKSVELPANRKAIEEARALGDLRENFEYKSARQRHEYLSARLAALNSDLSRTRPIDLNAVQTDQVVIGTRLTLDGGEGSSLTILGPWESDPESDIISYESELAQKILGKRVGDTLNYSGTEYTIAAIEVFNPA